MNKWVKILLIILIIDAIAVGGYFGYKALFRSGSGDPESDYEWVTLDENYVPRDFVEEYIKKDAEEKNIFPVQIKNYGRDTAVLRKFRGRNFAGPSEAQLNMMFRGLEDWVLIDINYKTQKDQEVRRTMLYVLVKGRWMVGDSGSLVK